MDTTVFMTGIGTVVTIIAFMYGIFRNLKSDMKEFKRDVHESLGKMDDDIKTIGKRMDGQAARMDGHATRIDQLYQVILEMLKERK